MNKVERQDCDRYESLVSSWIDDELDRAGQQEMLDHLVRCRSCRGYYLDARALDGLVAAVRPDAGSVPPTGVWERIARQTRPVASGPTRSTWMALAASVFLLTITLGGVIWFPGERAVEVAEAAPSDVIDVRLGQDRGQMTEGRFIDLTTEVLRADQRYRNAMLQILEKVDRDTSVQEASVEGTYSGEGDESGDRQSGPRSPA